MVKKRINTSRAGIPDSSMAGKRKRGAHDDTSKVVVSKKRYSSTVSKTRDRSQTPGTKIARFDKELITGPTPVAARTQSPGRSILRQDHRDVGPTAQLHREHEASMSRSATPQLQPNGQKQTRPRGRSPARPKSSVDRGTTGLTAGVYRLAIKGRSSSKDLSPRRGRPQHSESGVDSNDGLEPKLSSPVRKGTNLLVSLPDYPIDDEICHKINRVREIALQIADQCPRPFAKHKKGHLGDILVETNEETVRYIGCLAMGGPQGKAGWEELLFDPHCRRGLVVGIIGRALKENVFSELYFGAGDDLARRLKEQEQMLTHQDGKLTFSGLYRRRVLSQITGFFRTQERARLIIKHKQSQNEDASYRKAIVRITLQLQALLLPLWDRGPGAAHAKPDLKKLADIVETAASLSRSLRRVHDVVYYWPPTFKDEEFDPSGMECLNLSQMISESPYDRKEINGFERAVLRKGHEHEGEAIVRVVCFPSLVAYRQGGGDLAQKQLEDEENDRREREGREKLPPDVKLHRKRLASQERSLTGDEGFRTRVISKSVVVLQWGRQRLLTKEAGTSRHVDAMKAKNMKKYDDDYAGFVELYELYKEAQKDPHPRPLGFLRSISESLGMS